MKHLFALATALLLLATCRPAHAQAPTWQSAYLAGGNAYSQVTATATDASGNVYLAGYFSNATIVLGAITLTNAVTSGSQVGFSQDAFVAKWSAATKTFVWARRAGGTTGQDNAHAIAVSGSSVYVGATINGPDFGGGTTSTTDCLTKLTDAGTVVWVQGLGSTVSALAASGSSVYVAGTFQGTVALGGTTLTSAGSLDVAVARLNDLGTTASWAWAQRLGGPSIDGASAVAVEGSSVYVATTYDAPATYGTTALPGTGSAVLKLADAGPTASLGWAQVVPGATFKALAAGGGRLVATGSFGGTALFGSAILTSLGTASPFIARLTDAGSSASFAWAQQAGGAGPDYVTALAVSGTNVYIGGSFEAATGPGITATFGSTTLSTAASGDEFIAKLTDAGSSASFAWAKQAGNPYTTQIGRVQALQSSGTSLYALGSFYGTSQGFGSASLASVGAHDIFLTKLIDNGTTATAAWVQQAGGVGEDYGYALSIGNSTVYAAGSTTPVASFGNQVIGSAAGTTVGFLASLADASALASTPTAAALLDLSAYPNPTHGPTTVQLPAGLAAGPATLTLLDAMGRVVRTRPATVAAGTAQATLDVASLAPGVYALRVAVGERLGTARLVVE